MIPNTPGITRIFAAALCSAVLVMGCGGRDPDVVASVGDRELRQAELRKYLPDYKNKEDSALFARQFVDQWIKAQVISDVALKNNPNLEKEIEFKVNDYRNKLIMHEFATQLIRDSLDTLIRPEEVDEYYLKNQDNLLSTSTMYSFFYMACTSENTGEVDRWMRSSSQADISAMIDWAKANAIDYRLDSLYRGPGELAELAKGYIGDLRNAAPGRLVRWSGVIQGQKRRYFFKMISNIQEGKPLPLGMARPKINGAILNERKIKLVEETEKRIIRDARASNLIQE